MNLRLFKMNSLRFKITVLAILILAVILALYSSFTFFYFHKMLYNELDNSLKMKAQRIHNAVNAYIDVLGSDPKSFRFAASRVVARTGQHPHMNKVQKLENLWMSQVNESGFQKDYVLFLNSKSEVLARSSNLYSDVAPLFSKEIRSALSGHTVLKNQKLLKEEMRLIFRPAAYKNGQKCVIIVATSRERLIQMAKERLIIEMICVGLILVIALFFSQLFVRRIMAPIQEIIQSAKNINYKDLSMRISTDDIDLEMKDLVDALNEMMLRLERSFNYILEFSSHVSHELKTPLAIIRAESELALRGEHSPEEWRRVVSDNLEEAKRMASIIEDMLLLTRLDYQPHVFKFESFDLIEFFREMEEPIKLLAFEKNIHAQMSLAGNCATFHGNKTHLRRLFYNLVNNAIKYTPANGEIILEVQCKDEEAVIKVSDTGIGISKENLAKIFDKFFQVGGMDVAGDASTGLGLSIAQSIVKMHRGRITAESQLGKGTTFTVWLPLF